MLESVFVSTIVTDPLEKNGVKKEGRFVTMMFEFDAHKEKKVFDNHNDQYYQASQRNDQDNALIMALLDNATGWQN